MTYVYISCIDIMYIYICINIKCTHLHRNIHANHERTCIHVYTHLFDPGALLAQASRHAFFKLALHVLIHLCMHVCIRIIYTLAKYMYIYYIYIYIE